jgi:predicted Zn-dependent peptidase
MRVIGSIEDPSVIRAILEHLGLWLVRSRPPPKIHDPPVGHDGVVSHYAAANLQLQTHVDTIYGDPEYTWDEYIQS